MQTAFQPLHQLHYFNNNQQQWVSPAQIDCHVHTDKYEVRLAQTADEVAASIALRQSVFFDHIEEALRPGWEPRDEVAHHLIVLENNQVIGTVRLLNSQYVSTNELFYSAQYYQLGPLLMKSQCAVELSRFCISPKARNGQVLLLLWRAGLKYLKAVNADMMFGSCSFAGQDTQAHAPVLQYLAEQRLAPQSLALTPTQSHALPLSALQSTQPFSKDEIPMLLRAYLKLGARVSDHYYIDPVFNSTFVMIYVEGMQLNQPTKSPLQERAFCEYGVPTGIRTPVTAVKGRCPRPLDDGDNLVELSGIEPLTSTMPL